MCNNVTGSFTYGGKTYSTVLMPYGKTWMAENLDLAGNGGIYYNNAQSPPFAKAGMLYTWQQAIAAEPPGWHLPNDDEWLELVKFAGGKQIAGNSLKMQIGWSNSKGKSGNGTDAFSFSALGGGYYSPKAKFQFRWLCCDGRWWSSSLKNGNHHALRLVHWSGLATITDKRINGWFCSVRYIKN